MSISAAGALLPDWEATADVVIVGTGVAGLTAALDLGDLRVLW
jgi:ribulose 1,5-bisphosphate synthetase/thiazole synthase